MKRAASAIALRQDEDRRASENLKLQIEVSSCLLPATVPASSFQLSVSWRPNHALTVSVRRLSEFAWEVITGRYRDCFFRFA